MRGSEEAPNQMSKNWTGRKRGSGRWELEGSRARLPGGILVDEAANILRERVWRMMDGESDIPEWFVRGRTVLIPKEGFVGRPEQYR